MNEIPVEFLTNGIFIAVKSDRAGAWTDDLSIRCNHCSHIFWEGWDADSPESDWLILAVTHLLDAHVDEMRKWK